MAVISVDFGVKGKHDASRIRLGFVSSIRPLFSLSICIMDAIMAL